MSDDKNKDGYVNDIQRIAYKCNRCGAEIIQDVYSHVAGIGCPCYSEQFAHTITLGEAIRNTRAFHHNYYHEDVVAHLSPNGIPFCSICDQNLFEGHHISVECNC